MDDFYSYLFSKSPKATEAIVTDEKPEEKPTVECGLCSTEKDKKAGECKFDKGAEKPVRDALTEFLEEEDEDKAEDDEWKAKADGEEVIVGDKAPKCECGDGDKCKCGDKECTCANKEDKSQPEVVEKVEEVVVGEDCSK